MTTRLKTRVLVVDDSAFARKVMREVLEADSRFEVVGTARDGLDGLEKITELQPDVVTLDLVMPNLDGVGLLKALAGLTIGTIPRVVVVTMSDDSSDIAVSALQNGALALVHKPTALATDRMYEVADDLRDAVAAAATASVPRARASTSMSVRALAARAPVAAAASACRLVAIGTSTGGPQALTLLLSELPKDFPVPVAVALHIPVGYTEALSRRLDGVSAIEVVEAFDGVELLPGRAVIARAGMHLVIEAGTPLRGRLSLLPLDKPHRPSVDVLFETAAAAVGNACLGVVLTGMGDDGTLGARAVRAAGGAVLTEAEWSCVVYGMPRAVAEAGMSSGAVPLEGMAEEIRKRV